MANNTLEIKCRIEELPTVAGFIYAAYTTDKAVFASYSPDYNAAFDTNTKKLIDDLQKIISPKQFTAELKLITDRMYQNRVALRQPIDFLEGYLNRASGLTMMPKDFGISPVRTKNNNGDVEGLTTALNYLLQNTANPTNNAALLAKGYTAAQQTALQKIADDLHADNLAQNKKMSDRKALVQQNYSTMNALWAILTDICDTGKRLFKTTDKTKLDDYTITRILTRIRNEQKKTLLNVAVTANGQPAAKAVVTIQPDGGGRATKLTTDAAGKASKAGLNAGTYTSTCKYKDFVVQNSVFDLETNKDLSVTFELK